jgi:thiamine-monophosphate kinase
MLATLSQLGEFGLIRAISKGATSPKEVIVGIGDDTAVVSVQSRNLLLLTCDPVIEGVHFTSSAKPFDIGWKAMARNLSDIAAMGGIPKYALVAASFPKTYKASKAFEIHRGLKAAAKKFDVTIIGGDTSSDRHLHLTVTLIGEIQKKELVTRAGAKQGDLLCVTGKLGGSIFGKHLSFTPRILEARFLAQNFKPTAMMDVSDGLASDLQRLSEQSKVGFEIWTDEIPVSEILKSKVKNKNEQIRRALSDGEDYELLFTISKKKFNELQRKWKHHFKLLLTPIGVVKDSRFGIKYISQRKNNLKVSVKNDHFLK